MMMRLAVRLLVVALPFGALGRQAEAVAMAARTRAATVPLKGHALLLLMGQSIRRRMLVVLMHASDDWWKPWFGRISDMKVACMHECCVHLQARMNLAQFTPYSRPQRGRSHCHEAIIWLCVRTVLGRPGSQQVAGV